MTDDIMKLAGKDGQLRSVVRKVMEGLYAVREDVVKKLRQQNPDYIRNNKIRINYQRPDNNGQYHCMPIQDAGFLTLNQISGAATVINASGMPEYGSWYVHEQSAPENVGQLGGMNIIDDRAHEIMGFERVLGAIAGDPDNPLWKVLVKIAKNAPLKDEERIVASQIAEIVKGTGDFLVACHEAATSSPNPIFSTDTLEKLAGIRQAIAECPLDNIQKQVNAVIVTNRADNVPQQKSFSEQAQRDQQPENYR